ncbi:MAG: 30S ribosomal protein S19e [Methanosarcinales archaeon]|nr:30S ribosomal protein S19e [Methanosarcinales archaeon]
MTTVYDVPATELISKVAEKLKENEHVNPPEWANYVKTGVHKELPPVEKDWWYIRCASVLRTIYTDGPVGVERMRSIYGGKKDRGSKPNIKAKGSGSIARKSLQQLESAGFVKSLKNGRIASPTGKSLLDTAAHELKKELIKTIPGLEKY